MNAGDGFAGRPGARDLAWMPPGARSEAERRHGDGSWADSVALGRSPHTQRQLGRIAQVLYPPRLTLHDYHGREGSGLAWHMIPNMSPTAFNRTVWISTARLAAEVVAQHGEIMGLVTLASRLRELYEAGMVHKGKVSGAQAAYWRWRRVRDRSGDHRAWPLYAESALTRRLSPKVYTLARWDHGEVMVGVSCWAQHRTMPTASAVKAAS